MARSHVPNLSPKVLGASGTFTFQPSELPFPVPGRGISEFLLTITGSTGLATIAAGQFGGAGIISRLKVRAGGSTIFDVSAYELEEFLTQMPEAGVGTGMGGVLGTAMIGGAAGLSKCVTFRLPFSVIDAESEDEQDLSQFPLNKNPSIEIQTGANATASMFASVCTTLTDITPMWSAKLLGQAMNVPASAKSFRVPISEAGLIRAIGLSTQSQDIASTVWTAATGFQRYRIVLANVEKFNGTPLMLFESQRNHNSWTGDVAAAGTTIPALTYYKNVGMLPGPAGFSYIEVDAGDYTGTYTNAVFGAPAASTEYVLWAFDNQ